MKKIACVIFAAAFMVACSNTTDEENSGKVQVDESKIDVKNEIAVGKVPVEKKMEKPERDSKSFYLRELDQIDIALNQLEKSYETGSTAALKGGESESLRRWDGALNEIYGVLKEQLSPEEMEQLRQDQREWIILRDLRADEAATDFEDSSLENLAKISKLRQLTKERCYYLAINYLSEEER